jgi:hypothetical protein
VKPSDTDLSRYFEYLDDLRAGGTVNMFGAAPYLSKEFFLHKDVARRITNEWMKTFSHKSVEDRVTEALESW